MFTRQDVWLVYVADADPILAGFPDYKDSFNTQTEWELFIVLVKNLYLKKKSLRANRFYLVMGNEIIM